MHAGWIGSLARSLPGVVTIGQQGLVCFIAGAGVSVVLDSALRVIPAGHYQWLAGLSADALAIGSLLWLALTGATGRACGAWWPSRASRCPRMRTVANR